MEELSLKDPRLVIGSVKLTDEDTTFDLVDDSDNNIEDLLINYSFNTDKEELPKATLNEDGVLAVRTRDIKTHMERVNEFFQHLDEHDEIQNTPDISDYEIHTLVIAEEDGFKHLTLNHE